MIITNIIQLELQRVSNTTRASRCKQWSANLAMPCLCKQGKKITLYSSNMRNERIKKKKRERELLKKKMPILSQLDAQASKPLLTWEN